MLITRFMTPDGVGEVTDFMPIAGARPADKHRLVRLLRTVCGTMRFAMEVKPRFDYGRAPHKLEISGDGFVFSSNGGLDGLCGGRSAGVWEDPGHDGEIS